MTMNPAERWAALRLLESAVKDAAQTAKAEAEVYRQAVGAKSLESPFGEVYITRRKPTAVIDEDDLLAWAEEHAPDMIERRISPAALAAVKAGLVVDGDEVLTRDGEVVEWATVAAGSEYLTWRASPAAKTAAAAAVAARLDQITPALLP